MPDNDVERRIPENDIGKKSPKVTEKRGRKVDDGEKAGVPKNGSTGGKRCGERDWDLGECAFLLIKLQRADIKNKSY